MSRPAVFLDRDGVVNLDKYAYRPENIEWVTRAASPAATIPNSMCTSSMPG